MRCKLKKAVKKYRKNRKFKGNLLKIIYFATLIPKQSRSCFLLVPVNFRQDLSFLYLSDTILDISSKGRWQVECLAVTGGILFIRFIPWADVPRLIQGVTVKRSGGMGEDWEKFKAGMRSAGFDSIQTLKQVHGARVIHIDAPGPGKQGEISPSLKTEADGMVSVSREYSWDCHSRRLRTGIPVGQGFRRLGPGACRVAQHSLRHPAGDT